MTTTTKNVTKDLGEVKPEELAKLPNHHRQVLEPYLAGDHTYEGLAADLNIPVGTVRSRLNRARNALVKARAAAACTYPRCKCIVQTSTSAPNPTCPQGLTAAATTQGFDTATALANADCA